jgi:tRNA(fMet)-specific endonuclease VapC
VKFLLDTNACVHFLNGTSDRLVQRILDAGPGKIATSSITLAELHFGAARSARAEVNLERVETFADELASYPFDDACAARFGRIKAQMLSAGRPTPDFDLAIAAVAMAHGLTVVTADRHFADVPGLASVDWMK